MIWPDDEAVRALLAAVGAAPGDDTPRLVLADRLDELSGEAPAGPAAAEWAARAAYIRHACTENCPACGGRDSKADPRGSAASTYASGRTLPIDYGDCRACGPRRAAEYALLSKYRYRWARGPACPACTGTGRLTRNKRHGPELCPHCDGTGDLGGLTWSVFAEPDFDRGFPVAASGPVARYVDARPCGTPWPVAYRPTRQLAAIVEHHPWVTDVRIVDRHPSDRAVWERDTDDVTLTHPFYIFEPTARIPGPIFDHLRDGASGGRYLVSGKYIDRRYESVTRATDDLAGAVIRWARTCSRTAPETGAERYRTAIRSWTVGRAGCR
jgi:uncharacterized protein (TIGR02996 family)